MRLSLQVDSVIQYFLFWREIEYNALSVSILLTHIKHQHCCKVQGTLLTIFPLLY